ncbi:TetR/AcrR family transcriptional regulator [Kitasatospora sp. NPDC051853]|uniref:TetR/AcrR family transcriptional regulator n=1 Tax=Kitasatospora sp. NPDC051853 TaxID=3364058 RepID=UPI0037BAB7C5
MAEESRAGRRADAEQNRARILAVARDALARAAGDVTLKSIAGEAGVGQGTLYRHFATREALVLEVYRQDVAELVAAVDELSDGEDPWRALRSWFDRLAEFGRVKHGMAGALDAATRNELSAEHYRPVTDAIERLLAACREAGVVRADVDAADVLLLVGFLWRVDWSDDPDGRARRLLGITLDGLRAAR